MDPITLKQFQSDIAFGRELQASGETKDPVDNYNSALFHFLEAKALAQKVILTLRKGPSVLVKKVGKLRLTILALLFEISSMIKKARKGWLVQLVQKKILLNNYVKPRE